VIIRIKNYEFSDDKTFAWVDIDVEDDPSEPSATARFSFAISVHPSHTIQDIDRVALEELTRFATEVANQAACQRSPQ
jgi:hypothetical protein